MLKCALTSYVGAGGWAAREGEMSIETVEKKPDKLSPNKVGDLARDLAAVAGEMQVTAEERFCKHCIKVLVDGYGVAENDAAREARNVWWYVMRTRVKERED